MRELAVYLGRREVGLIFLDETPEHLSPPATSVVDPKLFFPDPDITLVSDPVCL
jgi:hypothetical protein